MQNDEKQQAAPVSAAANFSSDFRSLDIQNVL
jgi:hypothetical protein